MDPSLIALGRPMPAGSRVIESQRDFLILSLPIDAARRQQVAVLWDTKRTELVLDVLASLTFRDLRLRASVLALSFDKGALRVWVNTDQNIEQARNAVQLAVSAAVTPAGQSWVVEPLRVAPIEARADRRILDRKSLEADHPLLVTIPERYQLGTIGINKDSNSHPVRP